MLSLLHICVLDLLPTDPFLSLLQLFWAGMSGMTLLADKHKMTCSRALMTVMARMTLKMKLGAKE